MGKQIFVSVQDIAPFLADTAVPENQQYIHLYRAFEVTARRNNRPNLFATNIQAFRTAYRNLIGIERERVIYATYLDRTNRKLCDRCGGIGGSAQWPGYTCYECNGKGWTPKQPTE